MPNTQFFGAPNLTRKGTLTLYLGQSINTGANFIRRMVESEEKLNVVDGFARKILEAKVEIRNLATKLY